MNSRKEVLFILLRRTSYFGWPAYTTVVHHDQLFQNFLVTYPAHRSESSGNCVLPSSFGINTWSFLWVLKDILSFTKEVQSLPWRHIASSFQSFDLFLVSSLTFFSQATHILRVFFFIKHYIKTLFSFSSVWLTYLYSYHITSGNSL